MITEELECADIWNRHESCVELCVQFMDFVVEYFEYYI